MRMTKLNRERNVPITRKREREREREREKQREREREKVRKGTAGDTKCRKKEKMDVRIRLIEDKKSKRENKK